jgi:hypothetical protein
MRNEDFTDHIQGIEDVGLTEIWNRTTLLLDFMALRRVFDPNDDYHLSLDMEELGSDELVLLAHWTFACVAKPELASVVHLLVRKNVFPQLVKRLLSEPMREDLLPSFATAFLMLFGYRDAMKMAVEMGLIEPACHRLGHETGMEDLNVVLSNRVWFRCKGMHPLPMFMLVMMQILRFHRFQNACGYIASTRQRFQCSHHS